jgi:hypothetical protein
VHFLVLQMPTADLAERIRKGPIPTSEALVLARQTAAGLDAAHERGILHRDLKPSNIMLTSDGTVRSSTSAGEVADPAWQPAASHAGQSPTFTAEGTSAGVVLGTATYMSPEQARGKPVDKRADIWAFGCVLYEMLSGRTAFGGDTVTDVLAHVVSREPNWAILPPDTPRRVRLLLDRCLQKDPARRLRDIGDARLEFEGAESDGVVPAPARPSAVLAWSVAAVATLVAIGALAAFLRSQSSPDARPGMRFLTVTNFSGVEAQPSLSPDGRSVAFISNREGQWDIYVGLVSGGNDPDHQRFESRGDPAVVTGRGADPFSRLNESGQRHLDRASARVRRGVSSPAPCSPTGLETAARSLQLEGAIWIAEATGANPGP